MRPSVAIYVLLAASALAFWPSLFAFDSYWGGLNDRPYGYSIVALAMVWMAILARRLDALRPKPQPVMLAALLLSIAVWFIGWRGNSDLVHQMALLWIMLFAVWATAGAPLALRVAPPILYGVCALPIWDQLVPLLQHLTVVTSQFSMGLMDVPVVVDGAIVTIPEGTFAVEEGCSGKNYLMVTVALAAVAGPLHHLSLTRHLVLLVSSTALALAANWIRVFIVIYAGHASEMRHYFVAVEHKSLGYFIFAILLAVVMVLAYRVRRKDENSQPASGTVTVHNHEEPAQFSNLHSAITAGILSIAAAGVVYFAFRNDERPLPHLAALPEAPSGWYGPVPAETEWRPRFVGASDEQYARYTAPDGDLYVYRTIYGAQKPGRELIYFDNTPFAPGVWQRPATGGIIAAVSAALGASSQTYVGIAPSGRRWLMSHVYTVGTWELRNEVLVQAAYGLRSFTGPVPAGFIAVAAVCGNADCLDARTRVETFWREHGQALVSTMPVSMSP